MSAINNSLERGYQKYYNTLTNLGEISINSVYNLLIASWINNLLEGNYGFLVDDEQYNLVNQLYMCIAGDCLVPYQNYCNNFTVNKLPNASVRLRQTAVPNLAEDGSMRIT